MHGRLEAVWSVAKGLVARSAADRIADTRYIDAVSRIKTRATVLFIEDVSVDPSPLCSRHVLKNAALLGNASAFGILDESLCLIAEALAMWSPVARMEHTEDLKVWARKFEEQTVLIDAASTLHMARQCEAAGWVFPSTAAIAGGELCVQPSPIHGFLDDVANKALHLACNKVISKYDTSDFGNSFQHFKTALWEQLQPCVAIRKLIIEYLAMVGDYGPMPTSESFF